MRLRKPIYQITLMLTILLVGMTVLTKASEQDVLVYVSENDDGTHSVIIHDLATDVQRAIITHPGGQRNPIPPVISLDGRIAYPAYTDDSYDIVVWDNEGLTNLGEGFNPAWSADGRLAFNSDRDDRREIYMWDGETTTRVTNLSEETGAEVVTYPLYPIWSTDGRLAFQAQYSSSFWVYIWDDGKLTRIPATYILGNIAWSTDGRLAFANRDGLQIWDNGTVTQVELPDMGHLLGDFVWSLDGQLAFKVANDPARNKSELYIWDGETFTSVGPAAYAYSPTWSTDGRLAFPARSDNPSGLYVWDDGTLTDISASSNFALDPVWNADGRLAFSTTAWGVYVWDGKTTRYVANGILPQWMP